MKTLSEYFKTDSAYWGKRGHWLMVIAMNRDSDCLSRSNFRSMAYALNGYRGSVEDYNAGTGSKDFADTDIAIEEASHRACGWIEYLIINPDNKELVAMAQQQRDRLESYPVLDEEDWSNLEMEEANQVWANCYRPKERIEYIREHRQQFEANSLSDLLGCVRGKYFIGDASELLN